MQRGLEACGAGGVTASSPLRGDLSARQLWDCSLQDILDLSDAISTRAECSEAVRQVLELKPERLDPALLHDGERALPAEPRFMQSG